MSDIFTGQGLNLQYNTDTGNLSPQGVGNVTINEVNTFPVLTIKSETNTFETYNSEYKTVLLSDGSVDPFQIVVNYLPDDPTHQFLDTAAEDQTLFQMIIQYDLNMDESTITYAIVNGYITSTALSGDKDSVVTKSYTFQAETVAARMMTTAALLPIYQGDYGVGANTTDVPQYAPVTPTGNSFIKVPSTQVGNPAGADMMGIGLVDGTSVAEFAMTKTGTLSLYAKNATTAWTRIYTATQMDARYVPLTHTINGHALSTDVVLDSTDTGSLAISNNLSDLDDAEASRTNLDVYSKEEVDSGVQDLATSINSRVDELTTTVSDNDNAINTRVSTLEGTVTTNNNAINTRVDELTTTVSDNDNAINTRVSTLEGTVTTSNNAINTRVDELTTTVSDNDNAINTRVSTLEGTVTTSNNAALKKESNLSDVTNVATARTNLGLGTAATTNVGTSGAVVPLLSTANTWSGVQTFTGTISGSITGTASNVTGTVAIANGGTGATTAAAVRSNLGLGTSSTVNVGTSGAVVPLLSTANTWSGTQTFSNTITGSISGTASNITGIVSIANGGTGSNTTAGARANLGAVNIAGDAMSGVLSVPTSSGLRTADFTNTDSSLSYATISGEAGYAMLWRKDNSGAADQFIGIAGKALIFRQATDSSGGWADRTVYHSGNLPSVAEQGGVPVTSLGNVNLNDINGFNAGNYVQSANVNASTANNYPVPQSGSLVVLQNAANNTASCTQLDYPCSAGDVWMRRLQFSSGTVSAWTTWTRIAWNDANTMRSEIGLGSGDSVSFNGLVSSGNITCSSGVIYSRATSQTSNSHFWMQGHTGASRAVLYSNYSGITQLRVDNENTGASGYAFQFSTSGGFSCGSLTQTSDVRSKSNLLKVTDALNKVKQLNGYTFDVRVTEDVTVDSAGLIAQDIEKVLPIAVSNNGIGYDAEGNELENQKGVNYSALSALYVEAIKELSSKVEEQQVQIDELKALVQSLLDNK